MSRKAQLLDQAEESFVFEDQIDATAEDAKGLVDFFDGQDYNDDSIVRINVSELHKMLASFVALHKAHKQAQIHALLATDTLH